MYSGIDLGTGGPWSTEVSRSNAGVLPEWCRSITGTVQGMMECVTMSGGDGSTIGALYMLSIFWCYHGTSTSFAQNDNCGAQYYNYSPPPPVPYWSHHDGPSKGHCEQHEGHGRLCPTFESQPVLNYTKNKEQHKKIVTDEVDGHKFSKFKISVVTTSTWSPPNQLEPS
ncbi:hypothetical protein B0H16DRAFT_1474983 [Mycena metata]|uniref:Uncharacterized protein n=1 Tax=Mycena metata TaxID=1033252 RepID=A0AAD7MIX1_9AGAR|nr:hypothetical protein B0H16DRAFT_1474983 [Mycena metata]